MTQKWMNSQNLSPNWESLKTSSRYPYKNNKIKRVFNRHSKSAENRARSLKSGSGEQFH